MTHRSAGICLPLFSIRNDQSWGIGEYPDIGNIAPWLAEARLNFLMLLPLVEAALGQDSPYAAQSAFALDPVYVSLEAVEDFKELGGYGALDDEQRRTLDFVRAHKSVDYKAVRWLKEAALHRCFEHFVRSGAKDGARGKDLAAFREEQRSWLPDYLLFRALKEQHKRDWWRNWSAPLRHRDPGALEHAREELKDAIAFFEYEQWLAFRQLGAARGAARKHGVTLCGDLPFMVAEDSADVWSRQHEFRFDTTIGVPPDAYSADGQDWGLPVYDWPVIARLGFDWLKQRGQRTAQLFDWVRVDHVVGFYRTYARPRDKKLEPFFIPSDEPFQVRQGEAVMKALGEGGAKLVAEDLGTVPDFVRHSLTRMQIPGYRVQRWEQDLGHKFRDPAKWPKVSLATTGTHDSETLAEWWDALQPAERKAMRALPALRHLTDAQAAKFTPEAFQALLENVYGSASDVLVLPVQDVFGYRERINLPGTVGEQNWSYRMPVGIQHLFLDPFVKERTKVVAELARKFGR